jgi:glycosyltransferase involved in cell wall biosynthesis
MVSRSSPLRVPVPAPGSGHTAESTPETRARALLSQLRIAIVHEWFSTYAGSERVVEQILAIVPHADVFGVVDFLPAEQRAFLGGKPIKTSFIQHLPGARTHFRRYLPLMPIAIEQHDVSQYDLVISSSHAVAKGVLTGPDQVHVSYVHSPMRYAWDLQHQYLDEADLKAGPKSWLARAILHQMRNWDARSALGVDRFVANSSFIARRIQKVYRREAEVIYPPVDTHAFGLGGPRESFYLTASRMVPYKRVPLIVEAFSQMPNHKLVVIGDGDDAQRARALAGPNVQFLGHAPFDVLRDHMQRARAFVFAAEEDFGITPVEAQASGCPVIAFGKGGALETVQSSGSPRTGVLFPTQSPESIVAAIQEFEANLSDFSPEACLANAARFSAEVFRERFATFLGDAVTQSRIAAFAHAQQ